ncbi:MAG: hypothetical protein IPJ76_07435 [Flavobacteriales bacterium]|nr:MAG: hypothetical protein IPJ76_07435 [Flavobacteriales bacterium]
MTTLGLILHENDAQLVHVAHLLPPAQRTQALAHMRWCARTPYAIVNLVEVNDALVGYCTAVRSGTTVRIAHFFLQASVEVTAHSRVLADAFVRALLADGAAGVHVQCSPYDVPLWADLGFVVCDQFARYGGGVFQEAQRDEVLLMEPVHTLALLHLDRKATGEDRTPLLMEHRYAAQGYVEENRLRGALLPVLGHGYIVADAPEVGLELQRWLLPVQTHIVVPEANAAACAHLHERGYRVHGTSVRLVRGALPHFRPELVFAWPW